jgi:hypothetical protein
MKLPETLPVLLIATDGEPFASEEALAAGRPFVPSLEVVRLHSTHWVTQERKEEVTQIIQDWLTAKLVIESILPSSYISLRMIVL